MGDYLRHIGKRLPVLINDKHVMATAEIFRTPEKVLIQVTSEGSDSQLLADFLEQDAPMGISFLAIPVLNIVEKRENK